MLNLELSGAGRKLSWWNAVLNAFPLWIYYDNVLIITIKITHEILASFIIYLFSTLLLAESTTQLAVDIDEVTTANPPLLPTSVANVDPHPTVVAAVNETSVRLEAEEAAAAAAAAAASAAAEVDDEVEHNSFVALGGEGLEQGIRNAVKSEVESEIEADSSVLVATIQVNNEETEPKATSNNNEQTGGFTFKNKT